MTRTTVSFKPTESSTFKDGEHKIVVEIENSSIRHGWRMIVDRSESHVTSHYQGILCHKGYAICTDFWRGEPAPAFVPFRVVECQKAD
jgi:hypothetical protein